mmetsp:Transcript_9058/g.12074  ORF Transcript_9058/g.12074 Transcript_9058/m.12074 type:complete len:398 (+) Transcript_9058:152-1345(+)
MTMVKKILLKAAVVIPMAAMMTAASPSSSSCCFATRSISRASTAQSSSGFMGRTVRFIPPSSKPIATSRKSSSTELSMFMGSDGGILGVGAPEVALIVLVGYFVLGPSELYKLTKEIGKFIQNIRTLGTEATASFESSMEENLQVNELRKAQRELNDAFSFRRSINFDDADAPLAEQPSAAVEETVAATTTVAAAATATTTKKKRRRRVKKKTVVEEEEYDFAANGGNIPDLDMTAAFENAKTPEELLREERMARLESGTQPSTPDWFESAPEYEPLTEDPVKTTAEQERFAQQLSADWNERILDKEDELSPLAQVMERLAILEEERMAATARIEEEYRRKSELEEEFYRKKKDLLEEAALEISTKAFAEEEAAKVAEVDLKKEGEEKKEVVAESKE